MVFNADDTITLTAPDSLQRYFGYENDLDRAEIDVSVGNRYAADSYESYLLKGEFRYTAQSRSAFCSGTATTRRRTAMSDTIPRQKRSVTAFPAKP